MTSTGISRIDGIDPFVSFKAPCKVATISNITLSGTQTIDGVSVVADDRVLVIAQTTASENGIYKASATAWERADDFNGDRDIVKGTTIPVVGGSTTYGDRTTFWEITTANPIVVGTSNITATATRSALFSQAFKIPCKVATVSNITLSGAQTIDGVSVVAGDRVLVKSQSTNTQNGIYVAAASSWARAEDFSITGDVIKGTICPVVGGSTTYGSRTSLWEVTSTDPIVIGTDAITFSLNNALSTTSPYSYATIAAARADTSLADLIDTDQYVHIKYYSGTNLINADYDVVAAGTGTHDGFEYHSDDGSAGGSVFQLKLRVPPGPINVKLAGAFTDDASANARIQVVIDYLNASYVGGTYGGEAGVAKFDAGLWRYSGLILKKGVSLRGDGPANTIFLIDTNGATGIKTPAKASQASADNVADITIEGIGFGVHSSLTPSSTTIYLDTTGMTYCNFRNLRITCPANVIGVDNTGNTVAGSGGPSHWYNQWQAVHVFVSGGTGVRWGENDSSTGEQVTAQDWHGGSFKGTSGTAIHMRGCTGINFFGTVFEGLITGANINAVFGDSSGSRTTTSCNMHGCYLEQCEIYYHSNTNRCQRWGGYETSVTETDDGTRNGRVDYEETYQRWPRTYASGRITGTTINKSYNVDTGTGVTNPSTGVYQIPFDTDMPDTNYLAFAIAETDDLSCRVSTKATGSVRFAFFDDAGTLTNVTSFAFFVQDNFA